MKIKNFLIPDRSANKDHLRNLIKIAMSDGNMGEEELSLLLKLSEKLDDRSIAQSSGRRKFGLFSRSGKKFNQIYDLVCMMMVDGEINKNELSLCKDFAFKLGFLPRIVDDMISMIKQNNAGSIAPEKSYRMAREKTR